MPLDMKKTINLDSESAINIMKTVYRHVVEFHLRKSLDVRAVKKTTWLKMRAEVTQIVHRLCSTMSAFGKTDARPGETDAERLQREMTDAVRTAHDDDQPLWQRLQSEIQQSSHFHACYKSRAHVRIANVRSFLLETCTSKIVCAVWKAIR